ncbi:hypothetical protein LTR95_010646 [Oleoguttula sp. CCFEE 5521]
MANLNLDEIYHFAVQLGKDAGGMLLSAANARIDGTAHTISTEKESAVDIVTQTDRSYTTRFIGEESYSKGTSKQYLIDESPTWCVDPLDGTVNYIHLVPFYCVSIGFVVNHEPVIGVVNAPFLHQLFSACKGKGAWLNESQQIPLLRSPIPPLPQEAPKGCVFSCEWGKDRRDAADGNLQRKVESFVNMATELVGRGGKGGMVHGVRSLGSATLDLAYCAMGSFDIWWEGGCWEWDVCAGICLLTEAGGLITTANPPDDFETSAIKPAKLGGRLYLAIRAAGDYEGETGRQAQERTVRAVWRRVRTLDYSRPGV